ncbi:MAG: aminotransferase class I/II-fold pyridoxal phosphate-dependent enzyme [Fervidobacterium sp.]|uniref:aminotransferase class I/II-fold pyridoxal phosphate-dependent enzyme n=1 Tax=Fervidobacterium sp. TaxID=1871331 RepID=UPI004049460F
MSVFHGGINKENIIDFSVSINPLKPEFLKGIFELGEEYSSKYTYIEWFEDDFKNVFGEDCEIFAGATEVLQIIGFKLLEDAEVIISTPNYGEYERVAQFNNNKVYKVSIVDFDNRRLDYERILRLSKKIRKKSRKKIYVILSNPNNPTGIYEELNDLVLELENYGVTCIIDESFIDFVPEELKGKYKLDNFENVIRIRTFTKILGYPGIRIGYAKSKKFSEFLKQYRSPWGVGSLGYLAIQEIIKNHSKFLEFRILTQRFISQERERFQKHAYFPSSVNYFVIKVGNSFEDTKEFLKFINNNGMHVRTMCDFGMESFVRIGLKDSSENEKLLKKIMEYNKERWEA